MNHYYVNGNYDEAVKLGYRYYKKDKDNYYIGLLYAKSLIAAGNPKEALSVLSEIQVLPNEGATEGRMLFKQANLLLAIEHLERNKLDEALAYAKRSKEWPRNLGVGKPFQENIDERLEDWVTYLILKKMNDPSSEDILKSLSATTSSKDVLPKLYSHYNDLITAKALELVSDKGAARKYLENQMENNTNEKAVEWAFRAWEDHKATSIESGDINQNILSILMEIETY